MNFKLRPSEHYKKNVKIQEENYPRLTRDELEGIEKMFKKHDKKNLGYLAPHDLLDILRKIGHFISEPMKKRINNELIRRETDKIDLLTLLELINEVREWMAADESDMEVEYVDAFVALGGMPDKSGSVRKEAIIDLIKNEFELTFDIEELLDSFGINAEELDFQAFCVFCEGAGTGERINTKKPGAISIIHRSPRRLNSNGSFVASFNDFEKFYAMEQQSTKFFFY